MILAVKNIVSRLCIALMLIHLAVPCTVKRELKQSFDIPVQTGVKSLTCQSAEQSKSVSINITKAKTVEPAFPVSLISTFSSLESSYLELADITQPVPLFLLNRQLLI